MKLTENELKDIERYIDVKRREIYYGKGVILVEGIAEEYMIPKFAELMGKSLDEKGIIICNVNSTDFLPYVKLLNNLSIPYAIVTDGDFYAIEEKEGEAVRKYHVLHKYDINQKCGWLGIERIKDLIIKLNLKKQEEIEDDIEHQEETFNKFCKKFELPSEDEIIRDFEKETRTFLDAEKQLYKERKGKDYELEL